MIFFRMAHDLVCCPFVLSFSSFDGGLVRPATAPARGRTTTPRRVLPPHTSDRRRRRGQWFSREAHHLSASDPPTDRRPNVPTRTSPPLPRFNTATPPPPPPHSCRRRLLQSYDLWRMVYRITHRVQGRLNDLMLVATRRPTTPCRARSATSRCDLERRRDGMFHFLKTRR